MSLRGLLGGPAACLAITLALASAPAAPASAEEGPLAADWLATVRELVEANQILGAGANDPLRAPMDLCSAAGCAAHGLIVVDPDAVADLRALMAGPAADSQIERRWIAQAIGLYERLVGAKNGTDRDRAANDHSDADESGHGQLDCVAETTNTKTYLDRLALAGLLDHHIVGDVAIRFTLLLQHIAVELIEKESGERWVVDSWPGPAGAEPLVEPYWDWRLEWQV